MLSKTSEACERLSVHRNTLYRMVKEGAIPEKYVCRMGSQWRFNVEAIERHLLSKGGKP